MQLSVREASKILKVSEKTIYRWINQGELPAYRVDEQYRFNRSELLEWATSRKIEISPRIFDAPEGGSAPGALLAEALAEGGVFHSLECSDRESALRAIVACLKLPPPVDRQQLFGVLLAREELESTGVGDGIAIPHVRSPIVLHVQRPMAALFFLEKAIDFKALDGKPVHALFTLISPTVRSHLHLLSRLAFALRDPAFKEVILRRGTAQEILEQARRVEAGLPGPPDAGGREKGPPDAGGREKGPPVAGGREEGRHGDALREPPPAGGGPAAGGKERR